MLQQCKLLLWDECTMAHKRAIEALDRTIKDIKGTRHITGGMVVLLAGNFRQTLPVINKGTPADEINACLKASVLWRLDIAEREETLILFDVRGLSSAAQRNLTIFKSYKNSVNCTRGHVTSRGAVTKATRRFRDGIDDVVQTTCSLRRLPTLPMKDRPRQ
ncbi:hypothetical protein EVAR_60084_1 [Eumeta japonica]|uniref:ATP-dependent DNA helicase n=1 Tax=Eumeta variegata TaxID=151549 RepID=A0A4C1YHB9_EUMVA|nr:hypothetical protein EVAR_60084_1 [Eumeta japonica]